MSLPLPWTHDPNPIMSLSPKKHGHGHVCRVGHGHDTLTRQFSKNAGHDTAGTRQIYIYIYLYYNQG